MVASLREMLRPSGRIFVGDVRDARLHQLFAYRVETSLDRRGRGRTATGHTPAEARLRIEDRQLLDTELLLGPGFFADVAPDLHLQVMPRPGAAATEMNDFRVDVVLTDLGPLGGPRVLDQWHDWSTIGSLAALDETLGAVVTEAVRAGTDPVLAVRGIPNARTEPTRPGWPTWPQVAFRTRPRFGPAGRPRSRPRSTPTDWSSSHSATGWWSSSRRWRTRPW